MFHHEPTTHNTNNSNYSTTNTDTSTNNTTIINTIAMCCVIKRLKTTFSLIIQLNKRGRCGALDPLVH